ncbi:MAG: hypothetical protein Q9195_006086 [Heterodermia aff. obscurata]
MANFTKALDTSPLPPYDLKPVPALIPGLPDGYLLIALPIITYWAWGGLWYWIERKNYFPQYRIHTSAEVQKRNRIPLKTILQNVATQQAITTVLGIYLTGEPDQYGSEEHDQARWALRIRAFQSAIPKALALVGIDALTLADKLRKSLPGAATLLSGGDALPGAVWNVKAGWEQVPRAGFTPWEVWAAWTIYWYLVPIFQFAVAIFLGDSWQYFVHRTMHLNHWLYTNFHSIHHRVYVPHAFGAFYASILEAFVFDTIGTIGSLAIAQLTTRQAMWFVTLSTMKSLDDHCGYQLPWDPFQWLGEQDTEFHDIHHQSWGIKVYTTFWDHALGSIYKADDVEIRYQQGREAAERWVQRKSDEATSAE